MARKSVEANRVYYKRYYEEHKEEHKAAQDRYHEKCPRVHVKDSTRGYRLQYLYKITQEQYEKLLESQGGCCALCTEKQGDDKRRMAVDHNHECCSGQKSCGKCLRGILCADCNRKLGFLEQTLREISINLVIPFAGTWTERALAYLKRYQK